MRYLAIEIYSLENNVTQSVSCGCVYQKETCQVPTWRGSGKHQPPLHSLNISQPCQWQEGMQRLHTLWGWRHQPAAAAAAHWQQGDWGMTAPKRETVGTKQEMKTQVMKDTNIQLVTLEEAENGSRATQENNNLLLGMCHQVSSWDILLDSVMRGSS